MGSLLTLPPAEPILFSFAVGKIAKEAMNGSLFRGRTNWNIRACSAEKEEGKRGAENESSKWLLVKETRKVGCWMESEHSWSPVCSFTHGYTR